MCIRKISTAALIVCPDCSLIWWTIVVVRYPPSNRLRPGSSQHISLYAGGEDLVHVWHKWIDAPSRWMEEHCTAAVNTVRDLSHSPHRVRYPCGALTASCARIGCIQGSSTYRP